MTAPDPWVEPENDPAALRYELDGCRQVIDRYRRALHSIVDLYQHRPEQRCGGAVAIAHEALNPDENTPCPPR